MKNTVEYPFKTS